MKVTSEAPSMAASGLAVIIIIDNTNTAQMFPYSREYQNCTQYWIVRLEQKTEKSVLVVDEDWTDQVLLKFEPPSGQSFPTPYGRMVSHPHREPTALLLPLSRHTSSPTPTDLKATSCLPSVTLPHHPNPLPQGIPNQPPYFYTPVDHSVDWQD